MFKCEALASKVVTIALSTAALVDFVQAANDTVTEGNVDGANGATGVGAPGAGTGNNEVGPALLKEILVPFGVAVTGALVAGLGYVAKRLMKKYCSECIDEKEADALVNALTDILENSINEVAKKHGVDEKLISKFKLDKSEINDLFSKLASKDEKSVKSKVENLLDTKVKKTLKDIGRSKSVDEDEVDGCGTMDQDDMVGKIVEKLFAAYNEHRNNSDNPTGQGKVDINAVEMSLISNQDHSHVDSTYHVADEVDVVGADTVVYIV